ncbi:oligosaccharide MFS transporter [Staphylococcus sp. GSSP0090]|nr:oligosaccharide MFS transporter [Staphylococcus sp. GSSP0090]
MFRFIMGALQNESFSKNSLILFLFFSSWGIWWSFFEIWLSSTENGLGLTSKEIGVIYSVNSVSTLVVTFVYGIFQDKIGVSYLLIFISTIIASFIGPFFVFFYSQFLTSHFYIGAILGSVFLASAFLGAMGLYETVIEKFSRAYNFNYAYSRAFGSLGYAVASLFSGVLFVTNSNLIFWTSSLLSLLLLIFLFALKLDNEQKKLLNFNDGIRSKIKLRDALLLTKVSKFWILVLVILGTCPLYIIFEQQLFPSFFMEIAGSHGEPEKLYSFLTGIQVFLEVIFILLVPRFIPILGVKRMILLSFMVMEIRIGLSISSTNLIIIVITKLMHAIQIPLLIITIFKYINHHFNAKLSATVYLIGYILVVELGEILFSIPIGVIKDQIEFKSTFILMFVIIGGTSIFAKLYLEKDSPEHT